MSPLRVRVDNSDPQDIELAGFVNQREADRHFFKHVIRLRGLTRDDSGQKDDPEQWEELVKAPPLPSNIKKRRLMAVEILREVPGCGLGLSPGGASCDACNDRDAMRAVASRFSAFLEQYVEAGHGAIRWSLENLTSRGEPRLIAFLDAGSVIRLIALDNRRVRAVAVLSSSESGTWQIRLLSCYRLKKGHDYKTGWLQLRQELAGFNALGQAVTLQVV